MRIVTGKSMEPERLYYTVRIATSPPPERSGAVRLRSGAVGQAKANMLAFTQLARVLNAKATGGTYDVPTR